MRENKKRERREIKKGRREWTVIMKRPREEKRERENRKREKQGR